MASRDGSSPALDERLRRLRHLLLDWYAAEGRTLPWRTDRDPYRVLVSEIMLQQTQVSRVRPVYEAFCRRFPTVRDLAAAPASEVLIAWQGLGYNRRAVALHRAARRLVDHHGGAVPDDYGELRTLPGVGDYTARAILAFAYDARAAPVDANIARVLARAAAGGREPRRRIQALADALVPARNAGAWSSALMDLGARHCTARAPRCSSCPVAGVCAWRAAGGGEAGVADPAGRSGRATRFAGSDRYHRGRLVDALRTRPVPRWDLAAAAGTPDEERVLALVAGLVRDGLAEWDDDDRLRLPAGEGHGS